MSGLYIHVPFCRQKCAYCGFYSVNSRPELIRRYLVQLQIEASELLADRKYNVETVFIGGGNPLCLGVEGLRALCETILGLVDRQNILEWSIEANPENIDAEVIDYIAALPNPRLSMGVQRLDDKELALLGRQASLPEVTRAFTLARKKIDNISADFILGVPGCSSIAKQLERFLERFSINHVSAYLLSIEPDSEFARRVANKDMPDPEDMGTREYYQVKNLLENSGFRHYEISNFARDEKLCRHNINYWKQADYIGLGPAAVGTSGNLRRHNVADLNRWLENETPNFEELTSIDKRNEYLMLRLRLLTEGLNLKALVRKFGPQSEKFYAELAWQVECGNLVKRDSLITLSNEGILYADNIIATLFI
jgi:oxygen-independent coproporphyrinogen-3 oxidase